MPNKNNNLTNLPMWHAFKRPSIIILLTIFLAACGQTGNLYLPKDTVDIQQEHNNHDKHAS